MKAVAGLGNPGNRYRRTPHNAGFLVVEELARRWQVGWQVKPAFQAEIAECRVRDEKVLLVKPQTYMNASGEAVAAVAGYWKVDAADWVVAFDDADLPLGRIRLRDRGGSGGHRGVASILERMGVDGFARVRVGIGRREGGGSLVGHVLGTWDEENWERMRTVAFAAADAVERVLADGVPAAMNAFNGGWFLPGVPEDGPGNVEKDGAGEKDGGSR